MDQCLLHISASIAGQYQFPDKNDLISAVYWVRCDPPCPFQQKLTVAMQHCAVVEGSTNLSFVRASSHKNELPFYSFEKIEDCGSFTNHSSYGSILLDHFCGVGTVGESPVEKKYCSNVYYLGRELCNREIHFVVMRNHETYITVSAIEHIYPVRLRTRGRVITLSVHPWICLFVCLFVSLFGYTKMRTLREVGKHAMCTYHVRCRNEKIVASTYRTSESVLRRARKQGLFLVI